MTKVLWEILNGASKNEGWVAWVMPASPEHNPEFDQLMPRCQPAAGVGGYA